MPGAGMFTPGPIFHFVVIPAFNASQAFFLGTSVVSPKRRQEQYEIPVFNDLGGRSTEFQAIADGEAWQIFTTLNRFDYNVVRAIRHLKSGNALVPPFPNPANFPLTGLTTPLGVQNALGRGTLIIGSQDFQLILVNSYFNTPGAGLPTTAAVDLENAKGWASCSLQASEDDDEPTRAREIGMALKCRGAFNPTTRGFTIYFEGTPTVAIPPIT
jgi:hypothetical protein